MSNLKISTAKQPQAGKRVKPSTRTKTISVHGAVTQRIIRQIRALSLDAAMSLAEELDLAFGVKPANSPVTSFADRLKEGSIREVSELLRSHQSETYAMHLAIRIRERCFGNIDNEPQLRLATCELGK